MRSDSNGLLLRPLCEIDAEIEALRVYREKLMVARDLRFSIARLELNDMDSSEIDVLVRLVAAARGLGESRLYEKTRQRGISNARFIVFWLARKHTTLPLQTIGNHFGFDHSAVAHGVEFVEDFMEKSKAFRIEVTQMESAYLDNLTSRKTKLKPKAIAA